MKKLLTILLLVTTLFCSAQRKKSYSDNPNRGRGYVMLFGGLAFTVAAGLETNNMYMVATTPNPSNPSYQVYKPLPFWQQTPRQIMLVVGVSFSITGLIVAFHKY